MSSGPHGDGWYTPKSPARVRGIGMRGAWVAKESRTEREGRSTGRGPQRIGIRRLLGWAAFLPLAAKAPLYGRLFLELIRDDRTPAGRKAMLAAALGYLVVGRDLVPDDLPVIGGLDDLVVVVLAVDLFLDGVPEDVLDEKLDELGIDRRAFGADVARIRRFTPSSLRRLVRRGPELVQYVGDTLERNEVGPRVRAWINKEGYTA
jgi:hypothetical protein